MTAAKDLTKEAPRSPRTRLGDYALMARMIDKGRASLNGTAGEYHYACPLDQMLFTYKGVQADDVKSLLASGASDEQVLAWFNEHGASKTTDETKAWGSSGIVPTKDLFAISSHCSRHERELRFLSQMITARLSASYVSRSSLFCT
jgi:hypothetical protein